MSAHDGDALPLCEVKAEDLVHVATGDLELDAVAGGAGFVRGGLYLLFGPRGVGKSRFALQLIARQISRAARVLLVASEESPGRIAQRAQSFVGRIPRRLLICAAHDPEVLLEQIRQTKRCRLVLVDSIGRFPGDRLWLLNALGDLARERRVPIVCVMHATKDGDMRSTSEDEHACDVILQLFAVMTAGVEQLTRDDGETEERVRWVAADGPSKFVCLQADGKNRWGDTTLQAIYRHTARGFLPLRGPQ